MATEKYIEYRADYKYQLASDYRILTNIVPKTAIQTEFIHLDKSGDLLVKSGYAWDGPSGPVVDTEENMRGSLVHDALYQLMRNGWLNARVHRKAADQLFKDICIEDGVSNFRASAYYKALRKFGKPAASPQNKKVITRAPKT
ncbi:hypothetical protein D210916BOD24_24180 [Alteromonas sp. D210916BOD_24]|uniref:DUF1353 domain-containing protein n=1 Tax=Alteromonas sp. D210916BOD_24 TaxID=3157618 RepID=UPI00399C78F6